jgi:ech hydrogenase subunit B
MNGDPNLAPVLGVVGIVVAPLALGLVLGLDRQATAAMQLRVGPPVLQPLYDMTKLLAKASPATDRLQAGLLAAHAVLAAGALAIALAGGDLLVSSLVLGAAQLLFILAAGAVESPYSQVGAMREIVLMVAIEPLLLLAVLTYAVAAGSFSAAEVAAAPPPLLVAPSLGLTLAVVLAATLRKSPFDLASSHHAHQELVKGSTTEMAGRWLALAELGHWYQVTFVLLLVLLAAARDPVIAVALLGATYAAVVVADNAIPRATWRTALAVAWGVGGGAAILALATARLAVGGGLLP